MTHVERGFAWAGGAAFAASLAIGAHAFLVTWNRGDGMVNWTSVGLNTAAFAGFAAHHSLFARLGMKTALSRVVPDRAIRPLYVWVASGLFALVVLWWRPVGGTLYAAPGVLAPALATVQLAGLLLTVMSVRLIDALVLAGAREAPDPGPLHVGGPYRFVRHPLYLGWVLMVCGAPRMTGDRALFAVVSCAYLVLAVPWEERSLRAAFGEAYLHYSARVRWRIVPGLY